MNNNPRFSSAKRRMIARPGWKLLDAVYPRNLESFARCFTSRAIARLLHEARLPRMKTLDEFEFDRSGVAATQLRTLAEGDYVTRASRN